MLQSMESQRVRHNLVLVTAINMVLNFILEFFYQRFFVFRNSLDTNELAKK